MIDISPRRVGAALSVTAAAATLAVLPAAPAVAKTSAPPADAAIRAAHFSPTTPGVDVYLGRFDGGRAPSKLWLGKLGYGSVSGYQPLTPGLYTVAMRRSGASPTSRPMLTWSLNAKPHAAYTLAGVGAEKAVRGVVVKDDLTAPPRGQGRVRIIQAASRAPVVSVTATGGKVVADDVRFASVSPYATLPTGRWTVQARTRTAGSAITSGPVSIRSGRVTSILLLDGKSGGVTLRTVLDSSSSGVMPRSSVDAGAGGTAPHTARAGGPEGLPLVLAGVAVLLSAGVVLRRRTGR